MKKEIAMLLLMGGKSSRMGQNKAMLTYKGKTFWEKIIEEMQCCGKVYLSVDCKAHAPCETYPIIEDQYASIGPLGGIYTALLEISEEYVFVCACDTPQIDRKLIEKLCVYVTEQWDGVMIEDEKGRCYATAGIYSKKMLRTMEQMIRSKNYRLQSLIRQSKICYIRLEDLGLGEEVLFNVNTPEEYKQICLSVERN